MLKMSVNLVSYFALLLLLLALLMSCGGVPGDAAATSSYTWRTMTDSDGTLSALRGPSIVNLENEMVLVAEGHIKKSEGNPEITGVTSTIVEENGEETRTEISLTADGAKSGTKKLEETLAEGETKTHNVTRPTTVVKENGIYMLLTKSSAEGQTDGNEAKSLLFVSGTLSKEGAKKQVTWGDPKVVTPESNPTHLKELVASGGSGIAMEKDNRVAFPIQATKNGENVLLVMHGSAMNNTWKLSAEVEDADGCSDPAIVEWGEDIFLMIAPCAKGSYDVYKSTYLGVDWSYTDVPLTRVWGTSRGRSGSGVRSGLVTTTIESRKVLLVTLPVYSEDGKRRLHLFLTDNAHVYDVGPISPEDDDAAASNLLYTNDDKLTVVYEKKNTDASTATSLVSVRLTEQLEQIKSVVKTWGEVDKSLKLCTGDDRKTRSVDVSTEGLVGFLSGTHTDNEWKDEYLCVNATVDGTVTGTQKGMKFQGTGAGAEWPVGKLGQNQPYYFANNQFTLVATVTIHHVPAAASSPIPLIGVKMNDATNKVLFGLSYNHEKKWVPVFNDKEKESQSDDTWEKDKEYQVAITMKGTEWSVYIDGEEIYGDEEVKGARTVLDKIFEQSRISHFYIGGGGDAGKTGEGIDVTVENVLLYNHKLNAGEIKKLKLPKSVSSFKSDGEREGDTEKADQGESQKADSSEGGAQPHDVQGVRDIPQQQSAPTAEQNEGTEVALPLTSKDGEGKGPVAASSDGPSSTTEEKNADSKRNEESDESQGNTLSSSDPSTDKEQSDDESNTTAQEPQHKDEVAPAPKTHEPVKGEHGTEPRSDEKDTQPGNSVEEAAPPESHPPAKAKEESDGEEEEEKPLVGGEQEARPGVNGTTVDVEEEGNENSNEPTTPSGIDDRGNASSSGTDGASTRDENNVSNTDTNHPSPDANNEEALGSVEPAPGVRRQGNANSTATSSRSNRTSADSNNVTNSVLHLTNNDSTARESASHVFLLLLLFLGLYEVVALC